MTSLAQAMGNTLATERMRQLTDPSVADPPFSVAEARLALEATKGDVTKAKALLLARRAQEGGMLGERINRFLREQRPWDEFMGRFLWPEHLDERVQTNLLFYRANYAIVCAGITLVGMLLQPSLLLTTAAVGALMGGAIGWNEPIMGQRLALDQRLAAAGLVSSVVVHSSGSGHRMARIALVCGGGCFGHAAFRARSIAARWSYFKDGVEKED